MPYYAQKGLNILCFWPARCHRLNEAIVSVLFNQAAIDSYGCMMSFMTQDEETSTIVKPPAEFKIGSKSKPFKEGTIAYLNSVMGTHGIPLAYIICEQEQAIPNMIYQSDHNHLTPLNGVEFGQDNDKVFDLLQSWTLNGPVWTWVQAYNSTQNGHASWQALVAHYEGDAQCDRVKDPSIASAKYYGECKKFIFETYVTIHQDAHAELEQNGEVISEEKGYGIYSKLSRTTLQVPMQLRASSWPTQHYKITSRMPLLHCSFVHYTPSQTLPARPQKY